MLEKPDGCRDCILYGDGMGYVPGDIPEDATMIVVGQNPGAEEERDGRPLIGATGRMLDSTFLPLVDVEPEHIGRDNVIRCRWTEPGQRKKGNTLPKGATLQAAINHCRQYDVIPPTVRLIVAMGTVALAKYGPSLKQHEFRGHLIPEETTVV